MRLQVRKVHQIFWTADVSQREVGFERLTLSDVFGGGSNKRATVQYDSPLRVPDDRLRGNLASSYQGHTVTIMRVDILLCSCMLAGQHRERCRAYLQYDPI
jgi:hypothetical protein